MKIKTILIVLTIFSLATVPATAMIRDSRALEADSAKAEEPIAPKLKGLGNYQFKITRKNPESQQFFNQGLRLTYAFNHPEALRAFKGAARLDQDNAMAYWGWALDLGPNLNLPMKPDVVSQAYGAIQKAVSLKDKVTERERTYIDAMARRYAAKPDADRRPFDLAYASAMGLLVKRYPVEMDAATLYVAALMNLSPWDYWNLDGSPKGNTKEILNTLQFAAECNPRHPGALWDVG